jgi:hypothetical protein
MRVCSGIKADGTRCKAQPMRDSEYCLNHDPDRAEENRRRSSKGGRRGGRGRKQVELSNIKAQLQGLADGVLDGSVERADAAVASQILNVLLRAITVELQVRDHQEFVQRLESLEESMARRKPTHYGA